MGKKILKVLIACGSGVATSTVAKEAVEKIAKEAGISIQTTKGSLGEIQVKQNDVDLILTTANYKKPLEKPQMSVFGLISGVNEDKVKKELVELMKKLSEESGEQ